MQCHAKQYGTDMMCSRCNLVWDLNDPEPPECQDDTHRPPMSPITYVQFVQQFLRRNHRCIDTEPCRHRCGIGSCFRQQIGPPLRGCGLAADWSIVVPVVDVPPTKE